MQGYAIVQKIGQLFTYHRCNYRPNVHLDSWHTWSDVVEIFCLGIL
jgi:hypothetical protein